MVTQNLDLKSGSWKLQLGSWIWKLEIGSGSWKLDLEDGSWKLEVGCSYITVEFNLFKATKHGKKCSMPMQQLPCQEPNKHCGYNPCSKGLPHHSTQSIKKPILYLLDKFFTCGKPRCHYHDTRYGLALKTESQKNLNLSAWGTSIKFPYQL